MYSNICDIRRINSLTLKIVKLENVKCRYAQYKKILITLVKKNILET